MGRIPANGWDAPHLLCGAVPTAAQGGHRQACPPRPEKQPAVFHIPAAPGGFAPGGAGNLPKRVKTFQSGGKGVPRGSAPESQPEQMKYILTSCLVFGAGAGAVYGVRPGSWLGGRTIGGAGRWEKCLAAALALALALLAVLPMGLSPYWNGENPGHRVQYEQLAESFLQGRIDLDYGDMDPRLLEMENPYDPKARAELGVEYHWDHAFYNGRYYMYFGVAPVLLLFLPYRVVTGTPLTTYHGTQVFTALFIGGMLALLWFLAKRFFRDMPLSVFFSLWGAFSLMSVWYCSAAPAQYCTAISSALCVEVWSLFFFAQAVWGGHREGPSLALGTLGSLLGALAFGCRPTVALANLLAVPLFAYYVRGKRLGWRLLGQTALVLLPYVLVGAGLMAYNYVRFESPFEFGQSYQLTVADQSAYGSLFSQVSLGRLVKETVKNFFYVARPTGSFPYIGHSSVVGNFPICLLAAGCLASRGTRQGLRDSGFQGFWWTLLTLPLIITLAQVGMSPFLTERYRGDLYWLVGLLCFLCFGLFLQSQGEPGRRKWGFVLSLAGFVTMAQCFLLWCVPWDHNFTMEYPAYLDMFQRVLTFGLL